MPIPATPLFESFLRGTRLVREKPTALAVEFDASGSNVSEAPTLYLTYPDMEMKLDSVVRRIRSELRSRGCDADERIALATLGLICESQVAGISCVEHANRCLETTHSATLHQVTVLPSEPPNRNYRIARKSFSFEAFDPDRLLYWASRGNSAYPIDLRKLSNRLCIARQPFEVRLIDWDQVPGVERIVERWGLSTASASILDEYYQAVAAEHFSRLADLIKEDLIIFEGGALMNVAVDELLGSLFAEQIALFAWKGRSGARSWALLGRRVVLHTNLFPMSLYLECVAWLDGELGYRESSALDPTIRTYSRFLQRAHRHRLNERTDEAFLHFVIALDLLLGLEGRSSDSVCQRAALLVHRQLGAQFNTQVTSLKRLYDRRSKYVHEGKSTSLEELREIEGVCTEILWDLLAASNQSGFASIDSWLKQIDYVIASIIASRPLLESDFEVLGVPKLGCIRTPPNRVIDRGAARDIQ